MNGPMNASLGTTLSMPPASSAKTLRGDLIDALQGKDWIYSHHLLDMIDQGDSQRRSAAGDQLAALVRDEIVEKTGKLRGTKYRLADFARTGEENPPPKPEEVPAAGDIQNEHSFLVDLPVSALNAQPQETAAKLDVARKPKKAEADPAPPPRLAGVDLTPDPAPATKWKDFPRPNAELCARVRAVIHDFARADCVASQVTACQRAVQLLPDVLQALEGSDA